MTKEIDNVIRIRNHIGEDPKRKVSKKKGYNYRQTAFIPVNKEKYKGKWPIYARSSWELAFMRKMDTNPAVIEWASESFVVPYFDPTKDNTKHLYYTDFNFKCNTNDGIKQYIIEIKPKKETLPPDRKKFKSEQRYKEACELYVRNRCKWMAATEAAKKRGMQFMVLTEEDLKIKV